MSPRFAPYQDMLVELAEAGMAISREMLIGVRKADNQDQRIAYAQAHDRAARSVRLSIALSEKLHRAEHEMARPPAPIVVQATPKGRAVQERKETLRTAVRHSIYRETEGEDAETLEAALAVILDEIAMDRDFTFQPADELVRLIRGQLGLPKVVAFDLPWDEDDQNPAPPSLRPPPDLN